ncbi:MAG: DUF6452 family protein, partial [Flavobacterium sp.]
YNIMKKIIGLLLITVVFSSCEKDDVCAETTPTTPKVVIEFFDATNASDTPKNVTNLKITAANFTSSIIYNGTNKIKVPLKTFQDNSVLSFTLNGSVDPTSDDNPDEITFNYSRIESYISRACGFKTTFLLDTTTPILLTPDIANWIQNIVVVKSNIENENETHVKIYF